MGRQAYATISRNHLVKLLYFLRSEGKPVKVPMTFEQLGEILGITAAGVHDIIARSLKKTEKK